MTRWSVTGPRGYALAIGLTLAVALLRLSLEPWFGTSVPYGLFLPAVIVVFLFMGPGPGLACVALLLTLGWFVILRDATAGEKLVPTLLTVFASAVLAVVITVLRRVLLSLTHARDEAERLRAEANLRRREAERARDRSDLLARELNHRVKNLFAIVSSVVVLSGRNAPEAKATVDAIRQRINALALAHTVTQGLATPGSEEGDQSDGETVSLDALVRATLAPHDQGGIEIAGPDLRLPVSAVTSFGLILHELATNAAKYGALSVPEGTVSVSWSREGGDVHFRWHERGGPPIGDTPTGKGFGSVLLRQAQTQLEAVVEQDWAAEGLRLDLVFALPDASGRSSAAS